jgi:flagellar basal-body rod protein FlgB
LRTGSKSVQPFEAALETPLLDLKVTNPSHMSLDPSQRIAKVEVVEGGSTNHSGNSVDVDKELLTASEIGRAYSLNVGIEKVYARMFNAVLKG